MSILSEIRCIWILVYCQIYMYGKNSFAELSKNLTRYRFENNFVRPSK